MKIVREGLLYRIVLDEHTVSKKRFLSKKSAIKYYDNHENRDGLPVERR